MMDWKERTKELLAKKKMNQADLANKIGVTKAAVSIWLKEDRELSEKNTLKLQYQIASVLDVTPEYIISGISQDDPTGRSIPHLGSVDEITTWLMSGTASATTPWSICPKDCSEKTFSFSLRGSSMDGQMPGLPALPNDTVLFIDPEEPLEFGKVCLFYSQTPVVGVYEELTGLGYLLFANSRLPSLEVVRDNYVGRAIGAIYNL